MVKPTFHLRILPPELRPIAEKVGGHTFSEIQQLVDVGAAVWDDDRGSFSVPVLLPVTDVNKFREYLKELKLPVPEPELVKLQAHIRKFGVAILF